MEGSTMRRLALLLLTLSLTLPAAAGADTLDNQLAALRPVATQWWAAQGLNVQCDETFERAPLNGSLMLTMFATVNGQTQCKTFVDDALMFQPPAVICADVLHEWGHAIGLPHSDDPTNIMYGKKLVIPPVCAAWGAPPHKGLAAPMKHGRPASKRHMRAVMRRL